MTNYRVEIESGTKPTVCVDFDQDTEPTDDEIREALDTLSQEMSFDGYMAEWIVTEGGDWIVKEIEKYPA